MNDDHVPARPYFFRPVGRALALGLVALVAGATVVRAPLQPAADPAHAPDPAKSAWFLLWIQELVSHGTAWVVAVLALSAALVALPWLRRGRVEHAAWLRRGERVFSAVVLALAVAVVALTVVAMLFRGSQWRLTWPS